MDKTYCVFGDSVTQAAYVPVGWVELLRQYLEQRYAQDFINVFNLGIGGDTTSDVLRRFNSEALLRNPTSVIFAVGINDTKEDNPEKFENNLAELIGEAKRYTQGIIFIGLVLGDWQGVDPFSQDKTTRYNQLIKKIVRPKDCGFISLQEKLNAEDFQDGLHPNTQGHQKMFEVIREYFIAHA